jgi:hypothetical protein
VTEPRKPGPRITWETIERVAAKGDRSRIEHMTDEEIGEELRNAGIDPQQAADLVDRALGAKPLRAIGGGAADAKPPAKASRVARWAPWVGAAALAAGVLLLLGNQHDDNVGQGNPGPRPSETQDTPVVRPDTSGAQPDTPAGHAARMRANAAKACEEELWEICERLLNQAKNVDPAGESTPMVIGLRRELAHVVRDAR